MASGMTKTQLTRHLAEKLESNNKTAAAFLEHLADTAIKETKKNGVFVVPGLGRLVKAHRKARMGRNPQTGEPIQIKAKTVVKFRVAKAAKDAFRVENREQGTDLTTKTQRGVAATNKSHRWTQIKTQKTEVATGFHHPSTGSG